MTLAAFRHEDAFGFQVRDQVHLNEIGQVIAYAWQELPGHFAVSLDEWILMPDHLHAILFLENAVVTYEADGGQLAGTLPKSLGAFIQNFKAVSTRMINRIRHTPAVLVWQRNYYEHIIRSEQEYENIRRYIAENPTRHFLRQTSDYDV